MITLEAATLAFDAAGTPYSAAYGDIYHSADSGPGQARHVFLGGNDLPARWAGRSVFTIVETGFGIGINFLATWQAWRDDPARPARLHYVAIEKHPFCAADLAQLHERYAAFNAIAAPLHAAWPLLLGGTHRLHFENEAITLTLVFDDIAHALPRLRAAADAFYLDGFSPQKNPAMWNSRILQALARLARPGATLATYTTARLVKDGLTQAGFVHTRRAGFGSKRDMLSARYQPHWQPRHSTPAIPTWPQRRAIIIGAGMAGTAVAQRLARRGWAIDLIDAAATPAAATSGMHAGAFHPLLTRDDSITARLSRAGFLYAVQHWQALAASGHALQWQRCGLLQLATDTTEEARMRDIIDTAALPPAYAQYLERDAARALAGVAVKHGGWWFAGSGWMRTPALAAAEITSATRHAPALQTHFNTRVETLKRIDGRWQALDANGHLIASAAVVVLANAHDATRLVDVGHAPRHIRGQVAHLPAASAPPTRVALTGAGYLLPVIDGVAVAGASYDDDDDPQPHAEGYAGIVTQLRAMFVGAVDTTWAGGRVGFRCVTVDRLPMIGALPDLAAARTQAAALSGAQLTDLPRLPGLYGAYAYGSRGLIWAALAGEIIACLAEGEPLPLEADLVNAIDPARFVLKQARHGAL